METETIRLTITDDQGTLLDTVTMTRAEFRAAQTSAVAALSVLADLSIGS